MFRDLNARLNALSPPSRYAVIFAVALPFGRLLSSALGFSDDPIGAIDIVLSAVFGAIAGAAFGYIRARLNKTR